MFLEFSLPASFICTFDDTGLQPKHCGSVRSSWKLGRGPLYQVLRH
jgi:hypothetical protein